MNGVKSMSGVDNIAGVQGMQQVSNLRGINNMNSLKKMQEWIYYYFDLTQDYKVKLVAGYNNDPSIYPLYSIPCSHTK